MKEYKKPIINEKEIILYDIILVSSTENNNLFDFDEELQEE